MEKPDRRETEDTSHGANGPDRSQENGIAVDDSVAEVPLDSDQKGGSGSQGVDSVELRRRLEGKHGHIKELYDEIGALRLRADEAFAKAEASALRVGGLEEERARLKGRLRKFEEEERTRRRRREGQDRRAGRLEREIERREAEIKRLQGLLEEKEDEMIAYAQEARSAVSRKDEALEETLRRVEGLKRDLEEREDEVARLRTTVEGLRADLDLEYELRRRLAEPANRLRAGIDLFNNSEHPQEIGSISKSLGQPEVHIALGSGAEPPVILTFTWRDITWRTYVSNPGLAVEEPRVYLENAGEDLSGVEREPSNARVGPGGRVLLGR